MGDLSVHWAPMIMSKKYFKFRTNCVVNGGPMSSPVMMEGIGFIYFDFVQLGFIWFILIFVCLRIFFKHTN